MGEKNFSAKTLDEAITNACVELEVTSDRLGYNIIQAGSKGFFGLGAKDCIISAWVKEDNAVEKKEKAGKGNAGPDNNNKTGRNEKPAGAGDKTKEEKKESADNRKYKEIGEDTRKGGERREKKSRNGNNREKDASLEKAVRDNQKKKANKPEPDEFQTEPGTGTGKETSENRGPRESRDNRRRKETRETKETKDGGENKENKEYKDGRENNKETRENKENRKTGDIRDNKDTGPRLNKEKKDTGESRVYPEEDPNKKAEDFINTLFKDLGMEISYQGKINQENNELVIDLSGKDMDVLVGNRGQTLDALQYITGQVVNKHRNNYIRVKIDTENFRERRKEAVEKLAVNVAEKVKLTNRPVALEPMTPYERRIIHSCLQDDKDIITRSEGEEPYRHVVVCPVKKKREKSKN